MCQPAGELTDRLHFLRLTQFFLGMDQLGRALGDAQLQGIVQRAQRGTVAFGLDGRRSSTSISTPGKLSAMPSGEWSTRPLASIQ